MRKGLSILAQHEQCAAAKAKPEANPKGKATAQGKITVIRARGLTPSSSQPAVVDSSSDENLPPILTNISSEKSNGSSDDSGTAPLEPASSSDESEAALPGLEERTAAAKINAVGCTITRTFAQGTYHVEEQATAYGGVG